MSLVKSVRATVTARWLREQGSLGAPVIHSFGFSPEMYVEVLSKGGDRSVEDMVFEADTLQQLRVVPDDNNETSVLLSCRMSGSLVLAHE